MSSDFKSIVDIDKWQKIQDHFSEVLRVGLCTRDEQGNLLTKPSLSSQSRAELLKKSTAEVSPWGCDKKAIDSIENNWEEGCVTPGGVHNFFVPVKKEGETLAYLVVGPVILGKRQEESIYIKAARDLGIDEDKFLEAIREIKVFSFNGIKSVIALLYDIGTHICELGSEGIDLKEDISTNVPDESSNVHDFYIDNLLEALLEVSCNFTGAERGSIMFFDESQKELYVRIAKGIDKDIIPQARSKVGEGIAGIIAQENRPFFINENMADERIRSKLKNPHIKHAIGIPITVKEKVLGVLNLSTSKSIADKFTSESIATLDGLRQLVETTLGGIYPSGN